MNRQAVGIVKGFIGDENGEPVIGATVKVAGTTNGTITDAEGTFTLNAPRDAALDISYIGFKPKTIRLKGRSFISISLIPDDKLLDEVVVVGFGKQKKESLTGAVQAVKPEDLKITSSSLTTSTQPNSISGASRPLAQIRHL